MSRFQSNLRNREIVLSYIKNAPMLTQKQLAEKCGWSKGYVARLLEWLVRDNLVAWTWIKDARNIRIKSYVPVEIL